MTDTIDEIQEEKGMAQNEPGSPNRYHSQNGDSNKALHKRQLSIDQRNFPNKKSLQNYSSSSTTLDTDEFEGTLLDTIKTDCLPSDNADSSQYPQSTSVVRSTPTFFDSIHASSPHPHQTIQIFNTTIENNFTSVHPQQRQPDFENLRTALAEYYQENLRIQFMSGKSLDIEKYHVNLAIVEAQHKKHIEGRDKDLWGTRFESMVQIEELFNLRVLHDGKEGTPKMILIQGRAGIGKTTLCKKLVHQFIIGEWSDRFEAVIWIPLGQLKIFKPRSLQDLLRSKYFPRHYEDHKALLVQDISIGMKNDTILFILDGLDEIVQEIQTDPIMDSLLQHLLQQTHVIITSRPLGTDNSILPSMDLKLEIIGFSSTNIRDFVNSAIQDTKAAESAIGFIEKMPIIQSVANIPVLLDIICYNWESLPQDSDTFTVTKLYHAMIDKLLRNDIVRLGKIKDGKMIGTQMATKFFGYQVLDIMSTELEYLSYLAFDGIENNQTEFDYSDLCQALMDLDELHLQNSRTPLPFDLLEVLKQTSFLHTTDVTINAHGDISEQSHQFIHSTFQEYFAARWISSLLQVISASPANSINIGTDETVNFIQKNKYNPRYEVVWWMVAGQLHGESLELYFQLLQSAPRDLIGVRHQYLISGCFNEACSQLSPDLVNRIRSEIIQWVRFEMKFQEYDGVGLQSIIPDDIMVMCIDKNPDSTYRVLRALVSRQYPNPSTAKYFNQGVSSINQYVRLLASIILENQSSLSESTISALIAVMQNQDLNVLKMVADALSKQSIISESTTSALLATLYDQGPSGRTPVPSSRDNQPISSEPSVSSLVDALHHQDNIARSAAAITLGEQSTLPKSAVTALITSTKDQCSNVRRAAVYALSKQSRMSESSISAIIAALQDQNSNVRSSAADALGNQTTMSHSAVSALIVTLRDQCSSVRNASANALGKQSIIPESSISELIAALQEKNTIVRFTAAKLLDKQPAIPESVVPALVTAQHSQDVFVRSTAASLLSKISTLLEPSISGISPISDNVLGKQLVTSESQTSTYKSDLQSREPYVLRAAMNIEDSQFAISGPIISMIISAINGNGAVDPVSTTTASESRNENAKHRIREIYKDNLFNYSRHNHVTLSIRGNRLLSYTEKGFDESEELNDEVLQEIMSGFLEVQLEGGITINYDLYS